MKRKTPANAIKGLETLIISDARKSTATIELSTTHSLHSFALNKAIKVDEKRQWSGRRCRLVFYFFEVTHQSPSSTIVGRRTLKFHSIWIKNDFFKCPSCRCWSFWGQLNLNSNRFATVSVFAPLSPIIFLHDKSTNLCFSGLHRADSNESVAIAPKVVTTTRRRRHSYVRLIWRPLFFRQFSFASIFHANFVCDTIKDDIQECSSRNNGPVINNIQLWKTINGWLAWLDDWSI